VSADLDIAIIGAGAAGLTAAIFAGRAARQAGRPDLRIALLDGARQVGAKILIAGGGRCNVTHENVRPSDFNGGNRSRIAKVLRSFEVPATVAFFLELGVPLKREPTGKLFPITDRAQSVLDGLLRAVEDAGVGLRTEHRVLQVSHAREQDLFHLQLREQEITTSRLILATGGRSLPRTGSDGMGYELARMLGHHVLPTMPALVPLVLPPGHWLTRLSGVSAPVELMLSTSTGKMLHRERGSMLLTHFGLSGPVVLDMSRHWIAAAAADLRNEGSGPLLSVSFLPGQEFTPVDEMLLLAARERPKATVGATLRTWLATRLAEALAVEGAGVAADTLLVNLTREQRRGIVHALTALPLPVIRDRGYLFAEVTAGGVPLEEVDGGTMASRVCPGLHLCGEILDVDGRIGGFNFQWAWASGRLAGLAAAMSLTDQPN
jgi:predicted Rossmann fold flavoprotein